MNYDVIIYIITAITLVSTFGLMLTRDNQEIVKKSLVINMAMSCLLVVVGEVLVFLLLALFNFFIFYPGQRCRSRGSRAGVAPGADVGYSSGF